MKTFLMEKLIDTDLFGNIFTWIQTSIHKIKILEIQLMLGLAIARVLLTEC